MEFIDYTEKLNNHSNYIDIINLLEKKTVYIKIILINQKYSNKLIEKFKNNILLCTTTHEGEITINKKLFK